MEKFFSFLGHQVSTIYKENHERGFENLWKEKKQFLWRQFKLLTTHLHAYKKESGAIRYPGCLEAERHRFAIVKEPSLIEFEETTFFHLFFKTRLNNPLLFNHDRLVANFQLFMSKDYTPPDDPLDIYSHLGTLLLCYAGLEIGIDMVPLSLQFRLDYVVIRLVSQAALMIAILQDMGSDRDRTHSSTTTGKTKKDKMGELVFAVFDEAKKRTGRKPTVCSVTNKINNAFNALHNNEKPQLPLPSGSEYQELLKNVYNQWRNKEDKKATTVAERTVRRRLQEGRRLTNVTFV